MQEGRKVLLSLGANYFQTTAIKAAKGLGYYVVTADYLPENPGHRFSDKYCNVSTLDRDGVLEVARREQADGIISYASDVSAPTAAYVCEQLGLPTNPLNTVEIMTDKRRFHAFLGERGFFAPHSRILHSITDAEDFFDEIEGDIILKPPHGSGSKGITVVRSKEDINRAFDEAMAYADKEVVAEEYIEREGFQIAGDAFVLDGKIIYFFAANEHFDNSCNEIAPVGESFPCSLPQKKLKEVEQEVQKALSCLGFENGAVNLDIEITKKGDIFILELGPRSGGNLISDAVLYSSGVDLARKCVQVAVGDDASEDTIKEQRGRFVSTYIWHGNRSGFFDGLVVKDGLKRYIVRSDLFVKKGEKIHRFDNGRYGIGAAIMEFDNAGEMISMMDCMNDYYCIKYR